MYSGQAKAKTLYEMRVLVVLGSELYFHAMDFTSQNIEEKKLNICRNVSYGIFTGMMAQLFQKACKAVTKYGFPVRPCVVIAPCMSFNITLTQFQVLLH